MKAIFGVLSLVIVLVVVGSLAKKQLSASGVAGRADAAGRAASLAGDARFPADASVSQQAKAIQEQARERTVRSLQQGAERNSRADP